VFFIQRYKLLRHITINLTLDDIKFNITDGFVPSKFYKKSQENTMKIKKLNNKFIFSINDEADLITDAFKLPGNFLGLASSMGLGLFKDFTVTLYPNEQITSSEYRGNGSGFFIDKSGYIGTNYHVVENAKDIIVEFIQNGKKKSYQAKVVQSDKQNDISIIKIIDKNFTPLNSIPFKLKSEISDVATEIFTLGFPLALSVLGEEVKFTDGKISSKTGFKGNISTYQISVPVQPGNSGGPLFDYSGNLIGIVNAKVMEADNVSYAIKASYLKSLLEAMDEKVTIPTNNSISNMILTEKIKTLSEYVVLIKIK